MVVTKEKLRKLGEISQSIGFYLGILFLAFAGLVSMYRTAGFYTFWGCMTLLGVICLSVLSLIMIRKVWRSIYQRIPENDEEALQKKMDRIGHKKKKRLVAYEDDPFQIVDDELKLKG